jgi:hypothetical protein
LLLQLHTQTLFIMFGTPRPVCTAIINSMVLAGTAAMQPSQQAASRLSHPNIAAAENSP